MWSDFSWVKWILVAKSAKLFESATERCNLKKHLSSSVVVCDQDHELLALFLPPTVSVSSSHNSATTHSECELLTWFLPPTVSVSSSHNSYYPPWVWAPHIIASSHCECELIELFLATTGTRLSHTTRLACLRVRTGKWPRRKWKLQAFRAQPQETETLKFMADRDWISELSSLMI